MKLIPLLAALFLVGCSTLQNRPADTAFAVQLATLEAIRAAADPLERQATIVNVVSELQNLVDQERVTVHELVSFVYSKVDWDSKTPSEELSIRYLTLRVAGAVRNEVGDGDLLGRERRVVLGDLLENVLIGARLHR